MNSFFASFGFLGFANQGGGNTGVGISAPKAKLHVANGNIFISQPNSLVITSPNGACWFITVSNTGGLSSFQVTCPQLFQQIRFIRRRTGE